MVWSHSQGPLCLTGVHPQLETLLFMGHSADHKHQNEERTREARRGSLNRSLSYHANRGSGQLKVNKWMSEKVSAYRWLKEFTKGTRENLFIETHCREAAGQCQFLEGSCS